MFVCYAEFPIQSNHVGVTLMLQVSHLVSRVAEMSWFVGRWLGLAGRLQEMQDQGELG